MRGDDRAFLAGMRRGGGDDHARADDRAQFLQRRLINGRGGYVKLEIADAADARRAQLGETLCIDTGLCEGQVEAIEEGFPQKEIAEASYRFQQAVEQRQKVIVGVNDYVQEDERPLPILYIDESTSARQLARLEELRKTRDNDRVRRALSTLQETARGTGNTMSSLSRTRKAPAASSSRQGRKFIAGEPMKPATNRVLGA